MTESNSGDTIATDELISIADDSPETVRDLFASRGWGDGLPVVPPTQERVAAMLASGHDPGAVIATLSPRGGLATNRAIAVNAVLAGCRPELFPLLSRAVEVLGSEDFNLSAVNSTTHPVAPLVIVHGDAVDQLGFNGGAGAFGPGNPSNATLGRAIRLILLHIAGATPGSGDQSTQGQPSKYSFCIAENQPATPWESYPESLGISSASAMSLFSVEGPHNIHDMESDGPEGILDKIASAISTLGTNHWAVHGKDVLVALCPEHAATIASRKWTRADVCGYLFQRARQPSGYVKAAFTNRSWPRWMQRVADHELVPVTDHPDRFRLVVVGGPGKHSSVLPAFGSASITVPVVP